MLKIMKKFIRICLARAVISRMMIISIGTGALKANNCNSFSELGGNVILTDMWARSVLESLDWVRRKGKTGEVISSKHLLAEEKIRF